MSTQIVRLIDSEYPTWLVDVHFRGHSRLIACAVLKTEKGLALIDPGPSSTLHTLENALKPFGGFPAVRDVILTHIHLDHAGCVGRIAAIQPEAKFYVHPIGVRHLVDPERLIHSARRIYKDRMDSLWGEILPVPKCQVLAVEDGEVLDLGGRQLRSRYTPGHASHHIAWLEDQTGIAFAGDSAGMRIEGADHVIPVAPPPDINLVQWETSLQRLEEEKPQRLFLTHFGMIHDAKEHISEMRRRLREWGRSVQRSLEDESKTDAQRAKDFHRQEMDHMCSSVDLSFQEPYNYMGQPDESWYGLARYWRKKMEGQLK